MAGEKAQMDSSTKFDQILHKIGDNGRYQLLIIILTGLGAIPVGCFNLANVFFAATPKHWCVNNLPNSTQAMDNGLYNVNGNDSLDVHNSLDGKDQCFYTHGENVSEVDACTQWKFDRSVYRSTFATEWNFVCSTEWIASLSQTTYMLGFLIGGLCFGAISDRFGRKKAWALSIMLMIVSGLAATFVPNFWAFIAIRMLSGAGSTGTFTSGFVIMMEIVGKEHRMNSGVWYQAWFALGYMIMSAAAHFLRDFRHISLFIALIPVPLIPIFWFLDESPRWLMAESKVKDASKIIKKASKMNKTEYPEGLVLSEANQMSNLKSCDYYVLHIIFAVVWVVTLLNKDTWRSFTTLMAIIGDYRRLSLLAMANHTIARTRLISESLNKDNAMTEKVEKPTAPSANVIDLVRTPNMRKKTLILCFDWFVTSLVYYGMSFGTRDLIGGPYLSLFLSGLMEFPSFIILVLVLDRIGRRWPMALSLIFGGLSCLALAVTPKSYGIVRMICSMFGKCAVSGSFAVIYIYSAELFPTIVRTLGIGTGSMFARVAALVAPFVGLLDKFWIPLPYVVFGLLTLGGGLMTLLLPETLHQCLPETIEDGENFGKIRQVPICSCRILKQTDLESSGADTEQSKADLLNCG